MKIKSNVNFFVLLIVMQIFSQEKLYTSLTISDELKKNANAVVRFNDLKVSLKSPDEMIVTKKRIVTVLNSSGNKSIGAYVYYDNDVKIKILTALIYDSLGNQIKRIKKNDFKDISAVDGGTLYSDSRVKFIEYTPISYPYTVEFTCETTNDNTAFINSFYPLNDYYVSVENSSYTITYPLDISIRTKEKNFEEFNLKKEESNNRLFYAVKKINAIKPEQYSPSFNNIIPKVLIAANKFNYEGVYAEVENWKDMGIWFYNNLLKGRTDISEETKREVLKLVRGLDNPIDKAKVVYNFIQSNTRYISVQVGIGGMQPITAFEVDKVKYGDCKGLTNYTKSLLDLVGVKSNYTRLYASPSNQLNVDKEFVSFGGQTNHIILNIPQENKEDIWLECTSQKLPFGFIGSFTDDRDALVISPEGGTIKHTKKYEVEENSQLIKGEYIISDTGEIDANLIIASKGIQYDKKYWLETEVQTDLNIQYKNRWKYINNMKIDSLHIINDKNIIELKEAVSFKAPNYPKIIKNRMLVTLNAFNRNKIIPYNYKNRMLPLKIKRGFRDIDEVKIVIPENYKIESLPENIIIENKFGYYKTEVIIKNENTLLYKRNFIINDGNFSKEEYSNFRDFYKNVSKQDNAIMVITKK